MITALLALWLAWCALNLLLMYTARPRVPAYTGFRIVMPESLHSVLTIEEYCAVLAHEHGHQYHWHAWRNYARVCVFWFPSSVRLSIQECEADDYAAAQGCAKPLASAIRKLSSATVDQLRAARLELHV